MTPLRQQVIEMLLARQREIERIKAYLPKVLAEVVREQQENAIAIVTLANEQEQQ